MKIIQWAGVAWIAGMAVAGRPDVAHAREAEPVRFYVSPGGNDAWSGTRPDPDAGKKDGPFASLERARDAVRAAKAAGLATPVEVVIRGGVHTRLEPFRLGPGDGGEPGRPVTWRAHEGERVLLRGGKGVVGWTPWKDGIYRADLKSQGMAGLSFHQLFLRPAGPGVGMSRRLILARHPNHDPEHPRTGGFLYASEKLAKPDRTLAYEAGSIPFDRWADLSQAEVVSTYNRGWMYACTPIESVDPTRRAITVRPVRGQFLKLNRFFIQNVLGALDEPGEWYLDRAESVLYLKPPAGPPADGEIIVPVVDHLIEVAGMIPYSFDYLNVSFKRPRDQSPPPTDPPPMNPVEHIRFVGLDFEIAEQDGIRIAGGRHCEVVRCRFANLGNIGVNLGAVTTTFPEVGNPRRTPATARATGGAGGGGQILGFNDPCFDCRVVGCDVGSVGCEGVMLLGERNLAENNHVWDIGLYHKDAPCINLLGEANVARRNTLHDCPRCTVFIKGVDNLVELNDCHHANLETCDMGNIRMVQRNGYLKGNRIRFNRVLDTVGYGFRWAQGTHFESPFYTWGIYLDDYTCGTEIYGNIVAGAARGGIMLHGGGDNLVANNILFNAGSYGVEFAPMDENLQTYKAVYAGNRVERNIIVCTEPERFPYRFTSATRHMPVIRNNLIWTGGAPPVFLRPGNIGVAGMEAWSRWSGETGSILADPKLIDSAGGNFLPADDSPVWAMGFERIPVESIGCYPDPDRASWPLKPDRDRVRERPVAHAVAGFDPASSPQVPIQFLGPVVEDFEGDPAGQPPRRGDVSAPPPSKIEVTGALAASGRQSLMILDAPGLASDWMPRIYWSTELADGVARVSFDLRLDGSRPPALYIDPRQYTGVVGDYRSGPMVRIERNGNLVAGGETLATLPFDQWIRLELRMMLGAAATDRSELTVTVPGAKPLRLSVPHAKPGFSRLERVVIASLTPGASVFYIDNLRIEPMEPR